MSKKKKPSEKAWKLLVKIDNAINRIREETNTIYSLVDDFQYNLGQEEEKSNETSD